MNAAHLHLVFNHVPVIGVPLALLLLAWGILRRSDEIQKASLGLFVLAALLALPAYLTGAPAEEIVEDLAGVSGAVLGDHEELAGYAFFLTLALGAAALGGLAFFRKTRLPVWHVSLVLALALVSAGTLGATANLGGQVRHSEIRAGARAVPVGGPGDTEAEAAGEKGERGEAEREGERGRGRGRGGDDR